MALATRWEITKAVRGSDLPSASRLIMLTLADVAEVGTAEIPARFTPSLTVLARETGLARSTVKAHLAALDESGWLVRTRPDAKAQWFGERTRYRLALPESMTGLGVGQEVAQVGQEEAQGGPGDGPGVGREMALPRPGDGHLETDHSDQSQIKSDPEPRKRGTRIPPDFAPDEELIKWARENVPHLAGKGETEKFIDYWTAASGRNAVKRDWRAAWRVWMRTAAERSTGRPARQHEPYRNPEDTSVYYGDL